MQSVYWTTGIWKMQELSEKLEFLLDSDQLWHLLIVFGKNAVMASDTAIKGERASLKKLVKANGSKYHTQATFNA